MAHKAESFADKGHLIFTDESFLQIRAYGARYIVIKVVLSISFSHPVTANYRNTFTGPRRVKLFHNEFLFATTA